MLCVTTVCLLSTCQFIPYNIFTNNNLYTQNKVFYTVDNCADVLEKAHVVVYKTSTNNLQPTRFEPGNQVQKNVSSRRLKEILQIWRFLHGWPQSLSV